MKNGTYMSGFLVTMVEMYMVILIALGSPR